MVRMVRKQIYLARDLELKLKRRAEDLGISEAEMVRRYVEDGLSRQLSKEERLAIWEKELAFVRERAKLKVPPGKRTWTREELYEERLDELAARRYEHSGLHPGPHGTDEASTG